MNIFKTGNHTRTIVGTVFVMDSQLNTFTSIDIKNNGAGIAYYTGDMAFLGEASSPIPLSAGEGLTIENNQRTIGGFTIDATQTSVLFVGKQ